MKALQLKHICVILLLGLSYSCTLTEKNNIESTLNLAEDNRVELEAVLNYYTTIEPHTEKLEAARFLIANMRFHNSLILVGHKSNSLLDSLTNLADSLLFTHITSTDEDSLHTDKSEKIRDEIRRKFRSETENIFKYNTISTQLQQQYDCRVLTSSFLINHIDHIFAKRETSPLKDKLSFDDFCEYILPYRTITNYPLIDSVQEYSNLMDKYLESIPKDSVSLIIERYNFVIGQLRDFFPEYPYKEPIGYKELFFNGYHDCVPIAHFGASILRSYGIPIAVEYNSAYKMWRGRHFHCAVPDTIGNWLTFSPESELPQLINHGFAGCLNIYRFMFSEQKDTPFFIRGKDEFVPIQLYSPFIKDVTHHAMPTMSVNLPIKTGNSNKLAYLATFSSEFSEGFVPVTWGKINQLTRKITFENVVPERFYFPIYYNKNGTAQTFGSPFFVNEQGEVKQILDDQKRSNNQSDDIIVTRKFLRKTKLREYAENLVGTVVIASNNPRFEPRDTIATISYTLEANFQDIELDASKGPYQYYRIQTTEKHPYANIAEVQFLTDTIHHYTNVMEPSPLPILHPSNMNINQNSLVRLLDGPIESMKRIAEYDGNHETAPGIYPSISFKLLEPQYVTTMRIMPLHANNGINIDDKYQLFYWDNSKWNNAGIQIAKYNFLQYSVPPNKLYFLKNLSKGKEELPFTINDAGQQEFIYSKTY